MSKAAQTRQLILAEALTMATQTSLGSLTIGQLAKSSGLSKSGLFAHFNSKENLQVALIEYASELFVERVIKPIDPLLEPLAQLQQLVQNWLNWFDGLAHNCIFISATVEFDKQPGAVRTAIYYQLNNWVNYIQSVIEAGIKQRQLKSSADSQQLAYKIYSLYLGSQLYFSLNRDDEKRTLFQNEFKLLIEQNKL